MEMYGIDQYSGKSGAPQFVRGKTGEEIPGAGGSDPVLDGRPFGGNGKVYRSISLR